MPHKTVIRPARSQNQRVHPQKVLTKGNPNIARSAVKVTQVQRQVPVKQEIRVGHNSVRPANEHGMPNRGQINLNQKTRIYIPNTDRGYQTIPSTALTPPHNSSPQTMYMTSQGKVTSPVSYQSSEQDPTISTDQHNIVPKDERLSPNSTEVINAWEQSIKDPSPGSITFSNGKVQIHRTQVQVKSPQMQVKSPHIVIKSPQTQVKSPQILVKSPQMHQVKSPPMPQVKSVQMPLKSQPIATTNKTNKSSQNGRFNGNRIEVAKIPVVKQVSF